MLLFYKVFLSYDAQNGMAVEDAFNKTRHKGSAIVQALEYSNNIVPLVPA